MMLPLSTSILLNYWKKVISNSYAEPKRTPSVPSRVDWGEGLTARGHVTK